MFASAADDTIDRLEGGLSNAQAAALSTIDAAAPQGADAKVLQTTKQAATLAASSISLSQSKGDLASLLPSLSTAAVAMSAAITQVGSLTSDKFLGTKDTTPLTHLTVLLQCMLVMLSLACRHAISCFPLALASFEQQKILCAAR